MNDLPQISRCIGRKGRQEGGKCTYTHSLATLQGELYGEGDEIYVPAQRDSVLEAGVTTTFYVGAGEEVSCQGGKEGEREGGRKEGRE